MAIDRFIVIFPKLLVKRICRWHWTGSTCHNVTDIQPACDKDCYERTTERERESRQLGPREFKDRDIISHNLCRQAFTIGWLWVGSQRNDAKGYFDSSSHYHFAFYGEVKWIFGLWGLRSDWLIGMNAFPWPLICGWQADRRPGRCALYLVLYLVQVPGT